MDKQDRSQLDQRKKPVCITRKFITVLGYTSKIPSIITFLVEQAEYHNLPLSIILNRCVATVKARAVPIILLNNHQTEYLHTATLVGWQIIYCALSPNRAQGQYGEKWDNNDISFLPAVPNTIKVQLEQVEVTSTNIPPSTLSEKPTFGPRPDTRATNFNFEVEDQYLSFKLNGQRS